MAGFGDHNQNPRGERRDVGRRDDRGGFESRPPRKFEDRGAPRRDDRGGFESRGPRSFEDRGAPRRDDRGGFESRPPRKFEDRGAPRRDDRGGFESRGPRREDDRAPRRFEDRGAPRRFEDRGAPRRDDRGGFESRPPRKFEDRGAPRRDDRGGFESRGPRSFEDRGAPRRDDRGGFESRPPRKFEDRGAPRRDDRGSSDRFESRTDDRRRDDRRREATPRPPSIDKDVTGKELDRATLAELRTLESANGERVAKHLVMAGRYLDDNPQRAFEHAMAAASTGGRVSLVREAVGVAAYAAGDFTAALRELRTFRRISGSNIHLPLMADSERGLGRPEKALELVNSDEAKELEISGQVEMAIVASGAYTDLGQPEKALDVLEIPQLDINKGFSYSPRLFRAYAEALTNVGRADEAQRWYDQAGVAERALGLVTDDDDVDFFDAEDEFEAEGGQIEDENASESRLDEEDLESFTVSDSSDSDDEGSHSITDTEHSVKDSEQE